MYIPGGPVDIPDEMISTMMRPEFATLARLHRSLTAVGVAADLVEIVGGDHGSPQFNAPPIHRRTLAFLESVLALPLQR